MYVQSQGRLADLYSCGIARKQVTERHFQTDVNVAIRLLPEPFVGHARRLGDSVRSGAWVACMTIRTSTSSILSPDAGVRYAAMSVHIHV